MNIIVSSDIHNDIRIIYKIIELYKKNNVDYIFLLGDISDTGYLNRKIIKLLTEHINKDKIFIIPGNHDTYDNINLMEKYNIKNLHMKKIYRDNLLIAAFGGADVPIFMIQEEEIKKFLSTINFNDKYIIILSHEPPFGTMSSLNISGSKELMNFIKNNNKVILNIHGHMHETGGLEEIINNAKVLNVAREVKLINICKGHVKVLY